MANWLRRMVISKITLCDQGMNPESHVTLYKRKADMAKQEPTVESLQADLQKAQEALEASKAAATERDALKAEVETLKAKADPAPDPLEKADPEVRTRLLKAEAEAKATREQLAKMQEDAERREVTEIAKAFTLLNVDGFADRLLVLKRALPAAEFAKQLATFQAVEEQRAEVQKLFTEIGVPSEGAPVSFEDRIDQTARQIVEKSNGQLTYHQAYSQAMESPEAKLLWGEATVNRITKSKGH